MQIPFSIEDPKWRAVSGEGNTLDANWERTCDMQSSHPHPTQIKKNLGINKQGPQEYIMQNEVAQTCSSEEIELWGRTDGRCREKIMVVAL